MHPASPNPRVTVVIASYNYEQYIGEAIESVLAQTYNDWELVIVDDASPDNSANIIRQYQQQYPDKIRFTELAQNRGVGYVANLCYDMARGEFIAHLGSDDRMLPDRLQKQIEYFERYPDTGVVCSDVHVIDAEGRRVNTTTLFARPISDLRKQLLEGNFINSPSATLKKEIFDTVGKLNPALLYVQDYEHWLRVLDQYDIVRLDEKLTEYRIHGKNLSVANVGFHAYAGSYETVISSLRAIQRRDLQLGENPDKQAVIEAKLELVRSALNVERSYLSELRLSLAPAYFMLLDIVEMDPDSVSARQLLNDIYAALGDVTRAQGKKPLTVLEYQQSRQMLASGSLLEQAISCAVSLSSTMPRVVGSMLSATKEKALSQQEKQTLLFDMSEYLCKTVAKKANYAAGVNLSDSLRESLYQALGLFNKHLVADTLTPELIDAKTRLRQCIGQDEYQAWINKHHIREVDAEILAERMMLHWYTQPVIHCFMLVLPGEEALLADTIDSLAAQLTKAWQLTVVAAGPAPDPVFEQADFLHWRTIQDGEEPYSVLNQEISRHAAHWVTLIEPGMQYSPHALVKIADAINLNPAASYFYCDDDQFDNMGVRCNPRFKPDFNMDLLRASPYIGNGIVQGAALIQLGGFNAVPGVENYDLALRWVDIFGESAFCHIADVLMHRSLESERPFDVERGKTVLQEHFRRRQQTVEIASGYVENSYRIEYQHQQFPKVSIIIPTRDKLEYLQPCVESLLERTQYPDYEVLIVDNQSVEPDTLAYYEQLLVSYAGKVRVLHYDKPFNFSAMNNMAAEQARSDYLLLLNNDTEVIQADWLSRLMNHGLRDDVGIVGARLVYPGSGKLQHAGVYLGLGLVADHPYNYSLTLNETSHMERARLDQNLSAVTAAVMLVRKSVYQQLGGMDAVNLKVLFNDVDLCLRATEAGYKVVWTPFSIVVHHGSVSLKSDGQRDFYFDWETNSESATRARQEQSYMLKRWMPLLANDPCYNRNLSLRANEFNVELNAPLNWETAHHLRLRCFGVPISGGSGEYRMRQPFKALAKSGLASCETGKVALTVTELARLQADTVVFQNAISDKDIDQIRMYREFYPQAHIIFLLDDLLHDLPEKSAQYKPLKAAYRDARSRLRKVLSYCDRLIVSTEPLRDLCQDMIDDIVVVPNRLQAEHWSRLSSQRGTGSKPRVGWAGAQQHQGDLELIIEVVKETAEEVDWIFFGMCPDEVRPYIAEEHGFVPIEDYPAKLASLNLDLAIAPLEQHDFNKAKSNLRLLEYGIMGWPVVCSDIYPYQTNDAPVIRVANDKTEWVSAIRQILADPAALAESGEKLRHWVRENYILEEHLDEWLEALKPAAFELGMPVSRHLSQA